MTATIRLAATFTANTSKSMKQKFVEPRLFADLEVACRKLLELANAFVPVQDGRIYIEKSNGPFLQRAQGHTGRIQSRPRSCARERLAGDARERDLREIHRGRVRAVRLTKKSRPTGSANGMDALCHPSQPMLTRGLGSDQFTNELKPARRDRYLLSRNQLVPAE